MNAAPALIECRGVCKSYGAGALAVSVLEDLDLTLAENEDLAVVGASGSGKSTLLHLLGGLDHPDRGEVTVHGGALADMSERARCEWRNRELGFVYQFHHLLGEFTVLENVAMPLLIAGRRLAEVKGKATTLLARAGLAAQVLHKPHELSGGERQRVAVCRALITSPRIILADEPTGNLDRGTAQRVIETLFDIKAQAQAVLVIVTHDETLAQKCTRVAHLENGRLR